MNCPTETEIAMSMELLKSGMDLLLVLQELPPSWNEENDSIIIGVQAKVDTQQKFHNDFCKKLGDNYGESYDRSFATKDEANAFETIHFNIALAHRCWEVLEDVLHTPCMMSPEKKQEMREEMFDEIMDDLLDEITKHRARRKK